MDFNEILEMRGFSMALLPVLAVAAREILYKHAMDNFKKFTCCTGRWF